MRYGLFSRFRRQHERLDCNCILTARRAKEPNMGSWTANCRRANRKTENGVSFAVTWFASLLNELRDVS